jgi:hypothetical protein
VLDGSSLSCPVRFRLCRTVDDCLNIEPASNLIGRSGDPGVPQTIELGCLAAEFGVKSSLVLDSQAG